MERNLALELVRVTEAAALASARWVGKGNAAEADRAARDAVANVMDSVRIIGRVAIGDVDVAAIAAEPRPGNGDVPNVEVSCGECMLKYSTPMEEACPEWDKECKLQKK